MILIYSKPPLRLIWRNDDALLQDRATLNLFPNFVTKSGTNRFGYHASIFEVNTIREFLVHLSPYLTKIARLGGYLARTKDPRRATWSCGAVDHGSQISNPDSSWALNLCVIKRFTRRLPIWAWFRAEERERTADRHAASCTPSASLLDAAWACCPG